MKISNSYPYPVLHSENDDYINSSFEIDYSIHQSFGDIRIESTFNLQDSIIKEFIQSGEAVFLLHVSCPQTSYRKSFKTSDTNMTVDILDKSLRGKVFIHTFITVQKPITDYKNPSLNDWFKNVPINFDKGNYLAIGKSVEVTLNEDDTELMNLPAVVDIRKAHKNEFMEIDLYSDNLTISLPPAEYDSYQRNAGTSLKFTILSMVILPSLTQVFSQLTKNHSDLESYVWYQVMERIFRENGKNFEDVGTDKLPPLKAAQLVLRKPLKNSFEEIDKFSILED